MTAALRGWIVSDDDREFTPPHVGRIGSRRKGLREAQEIIAVEAGHESWLHLKFVHEPVFTIGAHDRDGFIMAFVEVANVKSDGNGICFVEMNV